MYHMEELSEQYIRTKIVLKNKNINIEPEIFKNGDDIFYSNLTENEVTYEELFNITEEQILNYKKFKKPTSKIDEYESESYILDPTEGDIVNIKGKIKIYRNGQWRIQEDIKNIVKNEIINVGKQDVNITAEQLLAGIIIGDPNGNKTWYLPSSSDIISIIDDVFVGKTFKVIFNNNSVTKKINLVLGSGMTTNIKNLIIKSEDFLSLVFVLTNIESGLETIEVVKG